jgi:hypothetical protein
MTRLAQDRVAVQVDVELTRDGSTFSWPADGRISQRYGCTGFRLNRSRGSCANFHDGIDIANVAGTPVRAMAAGVIAFVGWSPFDTRRRAFIVVVAHPGGLISRYAHMLPIRRVRVGQVVRKGELIARMGNTGNSTGSHLHVELLRGWTSLDPNVYLPARGSTRTKKPTRRPPDGESQEVCDDRPASLEAAVAGATGPEAVISLAGFLSKASTDDCQLLKAEPASSRTKSADVGKSRSASPAAKTVRSASSSEPARDPVVTSQTTRARSSSPTPR